MTKHIWRCRATVLTLAVLGATYLGLAALHTGPLNPISARYGGAITAIGGPYLEQSWSLFAPNPVSTEAGVLARARCQDGSEGAFEDITTKYITQVQHDRFFPERTTRIVSSGMLLAQGNDPLAQRLRDNKADRDDSAVDVFTPQEEELRQAGLEILTSYAAVELRGQCDTGISQIQLKFVENKFPGWSERHHWSHLGEITTEELPWRPVNSG